ncbi:hypothetical protein F3Y22_tig00110266pilonHSYRG00075 [Hibiscus syriacus]|uniref:DUF7745 domain-containing protein n=1 Tax=Hibiscus syriacus TaxID=106335 RepID=A0A6A3B4V0_HIBSY|nr:hypothetical protein F3Y22_tig00110266pilonHSYRG00075 [Hibiscus syriacus]
MQLVFIHGLNMGRYDLGIALSLPKIQFCQKRDILRHRRATESTNRFDGGLSPCRVLESSLHVFHFWNEDHSDIALIYFVEAIARKNPAPSILVETFLSLNQCRRLGGGQFTGCASLLLVWWCSHSWIVEKGWAQRHQSNFLPLMDFLNKYQIPEHRKMKDWVESLRNMKDIEIVWKAYWLPKEDILFRCGNDSFVMLHGLWGAIGYTPLIIYAAWQKPQYISFKMIELIFTLTYEAQETIQRQHEAMERAMDQTRDVARQVYELSKETVFMMDKGFRDQASYNIVKKWHPKKASRMMDNCSHKGHMSDEEQRAIKEIKEQMSRMMDRINALAKGSETSTTEKKELDLEVSNTQETILEPADSSQYEKPRTIIVRINKLFGNAKEIMETIEVQKDEMKPCDQNLLVVNSLLPTSGAIKLENPVQPKLRGGSHFDYIPISYKELYDALLEAREVAPHYVEPLQPPYPSWYDVDVRCEYHARVQGHSIKNCSTFKLRTKLLINHGVLEFELKVQPSLETDYHVESEPKVTKGKGICEDIQEEDCLTKYEDQIRHLRSENDKLSRDMEAMRDVFRRISQAFKFVGIGNVPDEWITGVTKLKNDAEQWRKNCKEDSTECLQLRESTLKIEKRDKVMKKAMTQANNVAHKWVDLVGFARELKQIDNSTPEHEWKLNLRLNEVEKFGVKAVHYM